MYFTIFNADKSQNAQLNSTVRSVLQCVAMCCNTLRPTELFTQLARCNRMHDRVLKYQKIFHQKIASKNIFCIKIYFCIKKHFSKNIFGYFNTRSKIFLDTLILVYYKVSSHVNISMYHLRVHSKYRPHVHSICVYVYI